MNYNNFFLFLLLSCVSSASLAVFSQQEALLKELQGLSVTEIKNMKSNVDELVKKTVFGNLNEEVDSKKNDKIEHLIDSISDKPELVQLFMSTLTTEDLDKLTPENLEDIKKLLHEQK